MPLCVDCGESIARYVTDEGPQCKPCRDGKPGTHTTLADFGGGA